jgi:hypothetical protein
VAAHDNVAITGEGHVAVVVETVLSRWAGGSGWQSPPNWIASSAVLNSDAAGPTGTGCRAENSPRIVLQWHCGGNTTRVAAKSSRKFVVPQELDLDRSHA